MTPFVSVSVAAAAVGSLLFFNGHERQDLQAKEVGRRVDKERVVEVGEKRRVLQPKVAPEFDGLNCFETLVIR